MLLAQNQVSVMPVLTPPYSIYLSDYNTGKFPMYMLGWGADYPDPNNFVGTFFGPDSTKNWYGWTDDNAKKVVSLIAAAAQASSESEREVNYVLASTIIYDQVPSLPLVNPRSLNATRTNIDGYMPNSMGTVVQLNGVSKN